MRSYVHVGILNIKDWIQKAHKFCMSQCLYFQEEGNDEVCKYIRVPKIECLVYHGFKDITKSHGMHSQFYLVVSMLEVHKQLFFDYHYTYIHARPHNVVQCYVL